MQHCLHIVTGAPGAGKSTTIDAFVRLRTDFIAFDIDWLAALVSRLVGEDIRFAPSLWEPYNELWFAVLASVDRNGKTPVLFAPIDARDLQRSGLPEWCSRVEWILLDCDDATRGKRLKQRPGWSDAMIVEAMADAKFLRQTVPEQIDTGALSPDAVASQLLNRISAAHITKEMDLP